MSEVTPPPAPVQQDHFFRNLIVVVVLAAVAFVGYKAYESKQESNDFYEQQYDR
jgi:predicted negative regulator of RcsB-dependent stress response